MRKPPHTPHRAAQPDPWAVPAWDDPRVRNVAILAVPALTVALTGCGSHDRAGTARAASLQAGPAPVPAGPAAQAAAVMRFAARGKPVYCGNGRRRLVALTFDDGPGPHTSALLRELRRHDARGMFFLVGRAVAQRPAWPRRQRERGAIGTHSMTHTDLTRLPLAAASEEIAGGRAAALDAAGPPVDLFRPPYGRRTQAIDREIRLRGMAQIMWDVNSTDSRRDPPPGFDKAVSARVLRLARPGSIVLLHERAHTIRALRTILPALRRRGLRAITLPELLAADPPSAARLHRGARGCP
jgi:peptidoglycan/xylan/chitin deacetylase (PgdA/CDA1 family)